MEKKELKVVLKSMMEAKEPIMKVCYGTNNGVKYILKQGQAKDIFAKGYVDVEPNLDVLFFFKQVKQNRQMATQCVCETESQLTLFPLTCVISVKQINPASEEYTSMLGMLDEYEYACNNNGASKPKITLPDKRLILP